MAAWGLHYPPDNTSACSTTVRVAASCMSDAYPCRRGIRFTNTRRSARTFSRNVQSMLTF